MGRPLFPSERRAMEELNEQWDRARQEGPEAMQKFRAEMLKRGVHVAAYMTARLTLGQFFMGWLGK